MADRRAESSEVSKLHDYRPDVWVEEVDALPSGRELLRG